MEREEPPDEPNITDHGRGASRHRARPRRACEARRGGRPLRLFLLDRHARVAEDQARAAQRFRESVHGQRPAIRCAFDFVRARIRSLRSRPDPDPRSRLPGDLSVGQHLCVDVCGPVVAGRALQPVPPTGTQAGGARYRSEGLRRRRRHRAGVHRHALARRQAGQGVRRRSGAWRGHPAAAPGVRLRHRILHRFNGISRCGHRHSRESGLGTEGCGLRRQLLAVRARFRLHGPGRNGRPAGVSAGAAERGRQATPRRRSTVRASPPSRSTTTLPASTGCLPRLA